MLGECGAGARGAAMPRKAKAGPCEALRGCRQFLLEFRDVLLARGGAAGSTAAAFAQDGDAAGITAAVRIPPVRGEIEGRVSALRQHLDRLRGTRKGVWKRSGGRRGARHRGP